MFLSMNLFGDGYSLTGDTVGSCATAFGMTWSPNRGQHRIPSINRHLVSKHWYTKHEYHQALVPLGIGPNPGGPKHAY